MGFVRSVALRAAFVAFLSALLILAGPTQAQQETVDLANQRLEDLMNVKVVSVSKTEEAISRTAAALFFIAQEEDAGRNRCELAAVDPVPQSLHSGLAFL